LIGLDTYVLVRYVAQDDRTQSAVATRLLERELTPDDPGYISLVTLAEVVWVLVSVYGADRPTVLRVLEGLLGAPQLRVQDAEAAWLAVLDYREDTFKADFSDALIARLALAQGCRHTATFDRVAARQPGFQLLR
jgi:predicted nucleic-acid-binding protein